MNKFWLGALCLGALAVVGCGDDDGEDPTPTTTGTSTATSTTATGTSTATATATGTGTATASPTGTSTGRSSVAMAADFGEDGILATPISDTAHDRFMAVATAEDGSFFATGFVNQNGDQAMVLAKFSEDGAPDTSFADEGVAIVNVASGGKTAEISRAVVVQEDGKIVIGGPVEHDTSATGDAAKDTDVAVLRFNEDGTLDGDFGDEGIAIFDLGSGRQVSENSFVGDNSWGIAVLGDSRLVVFGSTLAQGEGRTDSDLVLFAVDADGVLDEGFGEDGKVVVDIDQASINPRNVIVHDGMVLATGYVSLGGVVQPVIIRTSDAGELDSSFGDGGIASAQVLPGVAESYAVALQGDSYISAGYGRGADTAEKVDLIVDRWTADGEWDETFGENGVTRIDLAGQDDRARNVVVLPDGQILAIGSGKMNETEIDAMIVLLDEDGALVTDFGDEGHVLVDLGGPNDAFFGVALSADGESVIVAGYKGAATDGTGNDDAVIAKVALD